MVAAAVPAAADAAAGLAAGFAAGLAVVLDFLSFDAFFGLAAAGFDGGVGAAA